MIAAKDGAWISLRDVVRMYCSKCGVVETTTHPLSEREKDDLIRDHLAQHGGRY